MERVGCVWGEGVEFDLCGGAAEFVEFFNGFGEHADTFVCVAKCEFDGDRHLLIERLVGEVGAAVPADLDASVIGCVIVGLGGVEVTVPEFEFFGFGCEFVAVEIAEHVLGVGSVEDPCGVVGGVVDGGLEEVWAFEPAFVA